MNILTQILIVLVYAVISLGIYYGFKIKLLPKYKIKKRYLLIAMVLIMLLPMFILVVNKNIHLPVWISSAQMILFTVIFLIYLEVVKIDKLNKNKPVIGKPKAKPNRLKDTK